MINLSKTMNIANYAIDDFDFDFIKDSLSSVAEDIASSIIDEVKDTIEDKAKEFIKD